MYFLFLSSQYHTFFKHSSFLPLGHSLHNHLERNSRLRPSLCCMVFMDFYMVRVFRGELRSRSWCFFHKLMSASLEYCTNTLILLYPPSPSRSCTHICPRLRRNYIYQPYSLHPLRTLAFPPSYLAAWTPTFPPHCARRNRLLRTGCQGVWCGRF